MRWFISDTHFGHANIIRYCNRPFRDVNHMNEVIIGNWNSYVAPDDEVFHLGDVALGPWDKWHNILTRLNGFKTLVIGNHDRIFAGEKEKMRTRFEPLYNEWFDVVTDHIVGLNFRSTGVAGWDTQLVNLSHFPYEGDSHGEERYNEFRLQDNGVPLIHGHTHDSNQWATFTSKGTPQFHVGVDAHGFVPVPETTIIEWLESL